MKKNSLSFSSDTEPLFPDLKQKKLHSLDDVFYENRFPTLDDLSVSESYSTPNEGDGTWKDVEQETFYMNDKPIKLSNKTLDYVSKRLTRGGKRRRVRKSRNTRKSRKNRSKRRRR